MKRMHVIPLDSKWTIPLTLISQPTVFVAVAERCSVAGLLEKEDKRITPFAKQNPHYLCRRGSVRYARLCQPRSTPHAERNVDARMDNRSKNRLSQTA